MNLESIVKILIYMVVVKVIMSKINKKKQGNNSVRTPKTPDMPTRTTSNRSEREKMKKAPTRPVVISKNNQGLEGVQLGDLFQKSYKNLGPMGRMAKRERELESRNKR